MGGLILRPLPLYVSFQYLLERSCINQEIVQMFTNDSPMVGLTFFEFFLESLKMFTQSEVEDIG